MADEYPEAYHEIFKTIINRERGKVNLTEIEEPANLQDLGYEGFIDWYYQFKQYYLPEYESDEELDDLLSKQIIIYTIDHLILPSFPNEPYNVATIAVFTQEDKAVETYAIITEENPLELFYLTTLVLNKPVDIYIPPEPPEWYKQVLESRGESP